MFGRNCCWVPHPFPTADPWLRKVGHPLRPERKLLYTIFKVVFFASILQVFVHHSNINSIYYIIYVCIHIGIIYTYTYNQSSSFNFTYFARATAMASFKGILPPVQRAATMGIMMYMGLSSNKTQEFMEHPIALTLESP